jgi:hypothetical protein
LDCGGSVLFDSLAVSPQPPYNKRVPLSLTHVAAPRRIVGSIPLDSTRIIFPSALQILEPDRNVHEKPSNFHKSFKSSACRKTAGVNERMLWEVVLLFFLLVFSDENT